MTDIATPSGVPVNGSAPPEDDGPGHDPSHAPCRPGPATGDPTQAQSAAPPPSRLRVATMLALIAICLLGVFTLVTLHEMYPEHPTITLVWRILWLVVVPGVIVWSLHLAGRTRR